MMDCPDCGNKVVYQGFTDLKCLGPRCKNFDGDAELARKVDRILTARFQVILHIDPDVEKDLLSEPKPRASRPYCRPHEFYFSGEPKYRGFADTPPEGYKHVRFRGNTTDEMLAEIRPHIDRCESFMVREPFTFEHEPQRWYCGVAFREHQLP